MQVTFECRDPAGRRLRGFAVPRVRHSLRRVAWRVPRVELHMADINGPAGGTDKQCRVVLSPLHGPAIVISAVAREWRTAVDLAVGRAVHSVQRAWRRGRDRRRDAAPWVGRGREGHGI